MRQNKAKSNTLLMVAATCEFAKVNDLISFGRSCYSEISDVVGSNLACTATRAFLNKQHVTLISIALKGSK